MNKRSVLSVILYVTPFRSLINAAGCAAAAFVLYYFTPLHQAYSYGLLFAAALYVVFFFVVTASAINTVGKISRSGSLDEMFGDFASGGHALNDNMILGQSYVFCKSQGTIITYDSIACVFQQIYKYYGHDHFRLLIAIDRNGKRRYLCKLRRFGEDEKELNTLYSYLQQRQPDIHIGYIKQPPKSKIEVVNDIIDLGRQIRDSMRG
ncbi:MAG: hypothetical protein IIZ59_02495 [Clostridia bacterium]|nr:hypothetical protein [Clostridia bacterium]